MGGGGGSASSIRSYYMSSSGTGSSAPIVRVVAVRVAAIPHRFRYGGSAKVALRKRPIYSTYST